MSKKSPLSVYSEIGKLKKVLLHRPGKEVENLTPELMDRLLFDDIPYLEIARAEHDAFADIFKKNGVEVFYLEEMVAEAIEEKAIKELFLRDFIREADIHGHDKEQAVKDYFNAFKDNKAMVDKMMAGLRKEELEFSGGRTLADRITTDYPFIIDPMPNLYFTRDPFATIGSGVSLNHMRTVTRCRETLFAKYIFNHHAMFKDVDLSYWYDRDNYYAIEGGDELILSDKVVAIGISQRTDAEAIEGLARNIFKANESFETVLAFNIPKTRAFMHLDTVFTMVDYDKFTIHPEIEGPLQVFSLTKINSDGDVKITEETMELDRVLAKYLELDAVTLIRCGGKKGIDAAREQWNDGSNTLALCPGEVVVYSRNHVTNELLDKSGIKLHIMPSSELSRGRGGPRCMSMPLQRESL
ncbi:MAG: arginine deiminase [Clostridia bacterium]|nr:arginine deiminase [Clostridia bacterium]